jgi:hypothetical protein
MVIATAAWKNLLYEKNKNPNTPTTKIPKRIT